MTIKIESIDKFNEMVAAFIEENLTFDTETTSEYVGDMGGGGSMYKDSTTIRVMLADKLIASIWL